MLDVLVQSRRVRHVARLLMHKLLRQHGRAPRALVTNKLQIYAVASRYLGLNGEHRQHTGLNSRERKLAPASASAREGNAPIQVDASSATVRIGPRSGR